MAMAGSIYQIAFIFFFFFVVLLFFLNIFVLSLANRGANKICMLFMCKYALEYVFRVPRQIVNSTFFHSILCLWYIKIVSESAYIARENRKDVFYRNFFN